MNDPSYIWNLHKPHLGVCDKCRVIDKTVRVAVWDHDQESFDFETYCWKHFLGELNKFCVKV